MDFYPPSLPPPTAPLPLPTALYCNNRSNDHIAEVDTGTGAVSFPMGNATVGVPNLQAIAFHPQTGVLYTLHDHHSTSNNAALATFDFNTVIATELCELPFAIEESVFAGFPNDTYGWGGLTFRAHGGLERRRLRALEPRGVPQLTGSGTLAALTSNSLHLTGTLPFSLSFLFFSTSSTPIAFLGGVLKTWPYVTYWTHITKRVG